MLNFKFAFFRNGFVYHILIDKAVSKNVYKTSRDRPAQKFKIMKKIFFLAIVIATSFFSVSLSAQEFPELTKYTVKLSHKWDKTPLPSARKIFLEWERDLFDGPQPAMPRGVELIRLSKEHIVSFEKDDSRQGVTDGTFQLSAGSYVFRYKGRYHYVYCLNRFSTFKERNERLININGGGNDNTDTNTGTDTDDDEELIFDQVVSSSGGGQLTGHPAIDVNIIDDAIKKETKKIKSPKMRKTWFLLGTKLPRGWSLGVDGTGLIASAFLAGDLITDGNIDLNWVKELPSGNSSGGSGAGYHNADGD